MALWDKLKTELDRAGRVAQSAFDEGRARLDVVRVRQLADKAAQALGYAVYRARQQGGDITPDDYARLSSTLAAHEAEIARLEAQIASEQRAGHADTASPGPAQPPPGPSSVDPAMGDSDTSTSPPPGGSTTGGPGATAY